MDTPKSPHYLPIFQLLLYFKDCTFFNKKEILKWVFQIYLKIQ